MNECMNAYTYVRTFMYVYLCMCVIAHIDDKII